MCYHRCCRSLSCGSVASGSMWHSPFVHALNLGIKGDVAAIACRAGSVLVRVATNEDLPQVWPLITESYLALAPYIPANPEQPGAAEQMMQEAAAASIQGELQDFTTSFQRGPGWNFWVACDGDSNGMVVGCVALTRHAARTASLRCMAVAEKMRGRGIGRLLVDALARHAMEQLYLRVTLITANPRARDFYAKAGVGFQLLDTMASSLGSDAYSMVRYLGDRLHRHIVVTGGTHGNERIGVALHHAWKKDPAPLQRPTLTTTPVLANPRAVELNRRFVDKDLNRCLAIEEQTGPFVDPSSARPVATDAYEPRRALELQEEHGPKRDDGLDCKTDFWIDLHSTTSNTGLSIIVNGAHDCFGLRVAHHLQQMFPAVRIMGLTATRSQQEDVQSIASSGLMVEVGPIAQGILQPGLLQATKQLVACALDYIDAHNQRLLAALSPGISPLMERGLEIVTVDQVSEAALSSPFPRPTVDCFDFMSIVDFPRDDDGHITHTFHPDFDGCCFEEVREGTPIFSPVSSGEVINFQRPVLPKPRFGPEPGTVPIYALFINEAA